MTKKKTNKKKARKKKPRVDPFQATTDRIIAMIEADGMAPWHKPWVGESGLPTNLSTGKVYRGINVFTLSFTPFASHYWLTFNQARDLAVKEARAAGRKIRKVVVAEETDLVGASETFKALVETTTRKSFYYDVDKDDLFVGGVRRGEKKFGYVVFWKSRTWTEERERPDGSVEERERFVPMLKFTPIFNALQADGITIPTINRPEGFTPIDECEKVIAEYKRGPRVDHGGDRACYWPTRDQISLPEPGAFEQTEYYYTTRFHEEVHGTGHESRLKRKTLIDTTYAGSHQYSEEELVAEMGASFLAAHTGIDSAPIVENSAQYLKHWLAVIKKDPKLLVTSASRAQKAVDYILNREWKPDEEKEEAA